METVVDIEGVSKKFSKHLKRGLFYGMYDLLLGFIGRDTESRTKLRKHEFWAIKNVSLTLKKGEILGIMGRNGSGKTTLMRMLAGIFPPDDGIITVRGRLNALFATTSGMNPLLSGRENVYLRASYLGVDRDFVDEKMDEIIEFSELQDFIDAPFGTYSSGMRARLGFSTAISFKSDLLIVDEALAVGDRAFKIKCRQKMKEISKHTAIINISHSPQQIAHVCNRVMVINKGEVKIDTDDVQKGLEYYKDNYIVIKTDGANEQQYCIPENFYPDLVLLDEVIILPGAASSSNKQHVLSLRFIINMLDIDQNLKAFIVLRDGLERVVFKDFQLIEIERNGKKKQVVVLKVTQLALKPDKYSVSLMLRSGTKIYSSSEYLTKVTLDEHNTGKENKLIWTQRAWDSNLDEDDE